MCSNGRPDLRLCESHGLEGEKMNFIRFKTPEHVVSKMQKMVRVDLADMDSLKRWFLEYSSSIINQDLACLYTKDPAYMAWTYANACQAIIKRLLSTQEVLNEQ